MKKIGTFAASAGLIFLGIWMIISRTNPTLGVEVFKWWPIIFIIMGAEILISVGRRHDGEKIGVSLWVIPVILMFMGINIYQDVAVKVKGITGGELNLDNFINIAENIDGNYKRLDGKIQLPKYGKTLDLNFNNGNVNIKKSLDGKITINAGVYVKNDAPKNVYNIKELKQSDGYKIDINESYVRKVDADIYIPDGYNVKINGDNLDINQQDILSQSEVNINCDNGDIDLKGASKSAIECDNGSIDLKDVQNSVIKATNLSAKLSGDVQNVNLKADRGKVDLNNKTSKNVLIDLDQGSVDAKTLDDNVNVTLDINQGTCSLNGERTVNSGLNRTIGNGTGKVQITVDQGTVNFSSQE